MLVGEYPWEIKALCASTFGSEPSDDQLKYWREKRVIISLEDVPHPCGSGRVSLYAPGTAKLAIRLLQLLRNKSDLAAATWTLWIEGYAIDDQWTHQRLMEAARWWDKMIPEVKTKAFSGPNQEAFSDEFLNWREKHQRLYNRRFRLIRKLVGSQHFDSFLFHMFRLAFGHELQEPTSDETQGGNSGRLKEEYDIVITGLGFRRMLIDRARGTRPPTKTDIISPLNKIAKIFREGPLLPRIGSATNDDCLAAAREIQAIQTNNQFLYRALSWLFGRHAFGRGHAARTFDDYSNKDEVNLTMLWVVGRKAFLPELALEMQLHDKKIAENLYRQSVQAQQAAKEKPDLFKKILDAIRKRR